MAFLDIGRVWSLGETKSLDGVKDGVRAALRRNLTALTGQRFLSVRCPTKSDRDGTMTDRGRGFEAVSVLAKSYNELQ